MGHQLEDLIASWKHKLAICGQEQILNDVEWFVVQHLGRLDSLGAYFLRDERSVTGYGLFLRQNRPLLGYLGEIKILSIPLRCVRFVEPPHFPEEANAYDQILESLTTLGAMDGFFIRSLRLDSFLWNYLRTSPLIRRNFHLYLPTMRSPHYIISLPKTFEEYLQKFSAKSRSNLRRSVRKLQKDSGLEVRLSRITSPEQVDAFVDSAVAISKKTYQWRLAGSGLRRPDMLKRNFRFLAERGQLRCYLLWCGEHPCAFMICHQRNGECHSPAIGYDPNWERHSVGTILQFLVIEDLFVYDPPNLFDFGTGSGGQKEFFGNASFFDTDVYILRKSLYTRLACAAHNTGSTLATGAKRILEHYDLRKRIKNLIRKASVSRRG